MFWALRPTFRIVLALAAIAPAAGVGAPRAQDARPTPLQAALPLAPPPAPSSARFAPEQVLKLGYDVYVGGMNIFAFTIDVALDDDGYAIKGEGESRGMARMFWRWSSALVVGGELGADGVRPRVYHVDTYSKRGNQSMQLSFDGNGRYSIRRSPVDTPDRAAKRKLPTAVPAGSADPLTVGLRLARDIAAGRGCKGTQEIFDGNRRYDLKFTDLGTSDLHDTPYSVFSGPARRCRFDMTRISGFREPRDFVRFWDEDKLDPPELFFARVVPGIPPVPVRAHGDLNMGGLRIYLVWAEYGGKPVFRGGARPNIRMIGAR